MEEMTKIHLQGWENRADRYSKSEYEQLYRANDPFHNKVWLNGKQLALGVLLVIEQRITLSVF